MKTKDGPTDRHLGRRRREKDETRARRGDLVYMSPGMPVSMETDSTMENILCERKHIWVNCPSRLCLDHTQFLSIE